MWKSSSLIAFLPNDPSPRVTGCTDSFSSRPLLSSSYCTVTSYQHFTFFDAVLLLCCKIFENVLPGDFKVQYE